MNNYVPHAQTVDTIIECLSRTIPRNTTILQACVRVKLKQYHACKQICTSSLALALALFGKAYQAIVIGSPDIVSIEEPSRGNEDRAGHHITPLAPIPTA